MAAEHPDGTPGVASPDQGPAGHPGARTTARKRARADHSGTAREGSAILRVTQIKSTISHIERNRATARALGLKHIGHTVDVPANDATRGMVRQIRFLVEVEEVPATGAEEKA